MKPRVRPLTAIVAGLATAVAISSSSWLSPTVEAADTAAACARS